MNFKTNKIKLIARVMLLVLLVTSVFSFVGCDMKYKYILSSQRYCPEGNFSPSHFVATSDTTIFNKNDITFNIAYATYQSQQKNPKSSYPNLYGENPIMYFGLYLALDINSYEEFWSFYYQTYQDISSLQNIDKFTFIKGITDEEAFTEEYALTPTPFFISNGSIYNHVEKITIPPEFVSENQGVFVLKFICFGYRPQTNDYVAFFMKQIEFKYKKIDSDTIEIEFDKKNFMSDEL